MDAAHKTHTHKPSVTDETRTAAEFWEARYAESGTVWSGRVNPVLADVALSIPVGRALDLGCGEGGDAIWLAERGWTVTGVDLSPTAVERGRHAAAEAGIPEGALQFEAADLATWVPPHDFDLVTCSFLHSWPIPIPRDEILRRAAGFVAPEGHLLITAHTAAPSWANPEAAADHRFPSPESDLDVLGLDPERWEILACERREREAAAPDGSLGTLSDGVVLVRRIH